MYRYPACMCGGSLIPTDEYYDDENGQGHYYLCSKCGAKVGVIESVYL